ncbi:aspartate--tRNA ligase msd1 [Pleurotus ostreatus]|nr:aspartate--tRNA ligase msd1 [Pleurotus ostreatus]
MIHVAPRFLTVFSSFHRFRGGLPKCHKLGGHASKRSYSQQSQDPRSQIKPHSAPFQARTHTCGQLSAADNGSRVILGGWLLPERKGKLVSFFPLKDSHGTTQLIVDRSNQASLLHGLSNVPTESVVLIEGTVVLRPQSARRHGGTGDIDVQVDNYTLLNPADPAIPFLSSNVHNLPNDELRSRYRYLDLRRDPVSQNLRKRSQVAHIIRNLLHEQDFLEVETPVLLRSSPEGAREFLVPTRSLSGSNIGNLSDVPLFYALQQSPQQPKQLLMCSGVLTDTIN